MAHKAKSAEEITKLAATGPGGMFLYCHGFGDPDWPGMQMAITKGWITYVGEGQPNEDRRVSWYKLTLLGREFVDNGEQRKKL